MALAAPAMECSKSNKPRGRAARCTAEWSTIWLNDSYGDFAFVAFPSLPREAVTEYSAGIKLSLSNNKFYGACELAPHQLLYMPGAHRWKNAQPTKQGFKTKIAWTFQLIDAELHMYSQVPSGSHERYCMMREKNKSKMKKIID